VGGLSSGKRKSHAANMAMYSLFFLICYLFLFTVVFLAFTFPPGPFTVVVFLVTEFPLGPVTVVLLLETL
jgi:hypothetical protein